MNKQFFIFIGRSGSGKGTQVDLLKKALEDKSSQNIVHVTTGGGFREFIEGESYSAKTAKEITNSGGLLPEFLAVWNWSNIFINKLTGSETVILDGAPRKIVEVEPLHSAIHFYGYDHAIIVYVDVSEKWALERLVERNREDEKNPDDAKKKMEWFNEDVLPVLDMYSRDPRYKYLHINGEQTIEEVHDEIVSKLSQSSKV